MSRNQKIMIFSFLNKQFIGLVWMAGLLVLPAQVFAQGSLSLSVSPTLFEMTASPEQEWTSGVRVINANNFPITVYANPVNFRPNGEGGQGTLEPILETETNGETLAEWITIEREPITVPPEQTINIPFTIKVPEVAPPGGHFAAILVGTKPFTDDVNVSQVQTAQIVTSLVFLRVNGDVNESGIIRDFTTESYFHETPDVSFALRFQNTGNVHLRPQGDIVISNMWGAERGVIPINQQSQFGNVLPESIRSYSFSWSDDMTLADIGRYKAVTTLAYGIDKRQFTSSELVFWVLPWKAILITLLVLVTFFTLLIWGVKAYVRRMLHIAGVTPGLQQSATARPGRRVVSMRAQIGEGMLDLRSRFHEKDQNGSADGFTWLANKSVFVSIGVVILIVTGVWLTSLVMSDSATSETVSPEPSASTTTQTENAAGSVTTKANPSGLPPLAIVNRTGDPDGTSDVVERLLENGYQLSEQTLPAESQTEKTVIVYNPEYSEEILQLQTLFTGSLVSAYEPIDASEPNVVLYLGKDQLE